jgi:serine/threonine protein kinase
MSTLSPDQWQAVSPYLDQALDMADEERGAWLAVLRQQNPALAAQLHTLLNEHRVLAQEQYLEQGPSPLTGGEALAGQKIGPYTLLSPIGQGGMGTVWLAERSDGRFQRRVAVKFLSIGFSGGGGERFKREGNIVGRLTHPHIAELLDAGVSAPGQPYLVLEHVDGDHIDRFCDQRMLNVEARVRLFLDVLDAVAHAHANLIVHRDIKPSNVLVRNDGQVKLLDFGIAKLLEGEGSGGAETQLTREGGGALTPEYAAPEQVTGGAVTTATDVYALGVLLYVLLAGQHPAGPGAHTPANLVKAIVDNEPRRLSDAVEASGTESDRITNAANRSTNPEKLRRVLRGDLDTIVVKALKKDPRERYAAVTALADDLRRYLKHEPISAQPDTIAYRVGKFVRRNRTVVALVTLALLVSCAGIVGTLMQARTARTQRDFAFQQLTHAEAINDLDNFLLTDAAPSGKPFTANELLGRAERLVERQHDLNDVNHIQLLVSIGRKYRGNDQDASARRVLEQAYQLSRRVTDVSTRAQASCALGAVISLGGDSKRAETLVQEGLRELPDEPQFVLDRIFCFARASEVARDAGQSSEAVVRAQAAQQLVEKSPLRSDVLESHTLIDLAESYRVNGQLREASATFERASKQLAALGRGDTEQASTLFNNWALALLQSGRVLEAERGFRRAIDIERADASVEAVSPVLLNNYALTLWGLARLSEAAAYAEAGYQAAQKAGDEVAINQSLLARARIYRDQHDLARSDDMLAQVEPRLRRGLPAGHYAFGSLASERSLNALAKGDVPAAMRLADQAVAIDEASIKARGEGTVPLRLLLIRRSTVELPAHRPNDAAADAARALSLLQTATEPGTFSSTMGDAYLALANALEALGKHNEARAAARSAAEQLQNAIGPDHPKTRSALHLAEAEAQPR